MEHAHRNVRGMPPLKGPPTEVEGLIAHESYVILRGEPVATAGDARAGCPRSACAERI
jgi:hypothetical protein